MIRASSANINTINSKTITSFQMNSTNLKATSIVADQFAAQESNLGNASATTLVVSGDIEARDLISSQSLAATEASFGNVTANNLVMNSRSNDPAEQVHNSLVVGTGSSIQGNSSVVLGGSNTVRAHRSVAIGSSNLVVANDAIAIGYALTNVARGKSIVLGFHEAALYIGDYSETIGTPFQPEFSPLFRSQPDSSSIGNIASNNLSPGSVTNHVLYHRPDSRVGIGTMDPQRKLHVGDAMRLEPLRSAPENPAMGDMYVHKSGALCMYFSYEDGEGYWEKAAGHGECPVNSDSFYSPELFEAIDKNKPVHGPIIPHPEFNPGLFPVSEE
jgi:hypothetical protein